MTTVKDIQDCNDLASLKNWANQLDVPYSGNIKLDTLKSRVIDALKEITPNKVAPPKQYSDTELMAMDPNTILDPILRRKVVKTKALRLMRVRVTCLDPAEAQTPGAIITVHNKYTGKVSKYVPFNSNQVNGYHIPKIIYDHLVNAEFIFRSVKTGATVKDTEVVSKRMKKFSIEVMPSLTLEELEDLAKKQRASGSIDEEE